MSAFRVTGDVLVYEESAVDFATVADELGLSSSRVGTCEKTSSALDAAALEGDASLVTVRTAPSEPQTAARMGGE